MSWKDYIICPKCERKEYAPFASVFHVHFKCCPRCGTRKPEPWGLNRPEGEWPMVRMRWIDTVTWWKPSTWGSGYWEVHEDDLRRLPEGSCYLPKKEPSGTGFIGTNCETGKKRQETLFMSLLLSCSLLLSLLSCAR